MNRPTTLCIYLIILLLFLSFTNQQQCNSNEVCKYFYHYDGDDKLPNFDQMVVNPIPKSGRFAFSVTTEKFTEGGAIVSTYPISSNKYPLLPKDTEKTSINPDLVRNFPDNWLECKKNENYCNTTCVEAIKKSGLHTQSNFMNFQIESPCKGKFTTNKALAVHEWLSLTNDEKKRVCKKMSSNSRLTLVCTLYVEYVHAHVKHNPQARYNAIIAPITLSLTWFLKSSATVESKYFIVRNTEARMTDDGFLEGTTTIFGQPNHFLSNCVPSKRKQSFIPFDIEVKRENYGYKSFIQSKEKKEKFKGDLFYTCDQEKCVGGDICQALGKAYFKFSVDVNPGKGSGSTEFDVDSTVTQGDNQNPYEIPTHGVIGNGYERSGIKFTTRNNKDFKKRFYSLHYCRINTDTGKRDNKMCGDVIRKGELVNKKLREDTGFIYHNQEKMKKLGYNSSVGFALRTKILKKNGGTWRVNAVFEYSHEKTALYSETSKTTIFDTIDTKEFNGNPPNDDKSSSNSTLLFVIAIVSSGIGITLFVALVATLLTIYIKRRNLAYKEIE